MTSSSSQEHTCFGRIFTGTPRDIAERECPACICTPTADKCPQHGYASCPIENLPSDELDAVADALNGATLPELDDDAIEAEELAQIAFEEEQRAQQLEDVRSLYGEAAVKLMRNGWTLDSAIAHVEGSCDRELCTALHDDDVIEAVTIGGRSYDVDAEGYSSQLDCYIARTPSGELVTIPADRESER